jgi:hypothetical protein
MEVKYLIRPVVKLILCVLTYSGFIACSTGVGFAFWKASESVERHSVAFGMLYFGMVVMGFLSALWLLNFIGSFLRCAYDIYREFI